VSSFPLFLRSYEDLEAHIDEFFSKLPNVEKGDRFANFAARLVPFVPDLRRFGEATLAEKKSHDGGVDIVSTPLEEAPGCAFSRSFELQRRRTSTPL
jgi:hypothetical protein